MSACKFSFINKSKQASDEAVFGNQHIFSNQSTSDTTNNSFDSTDVVEIVISVAVVMVIVVIVVVLCVRKSNGEREKGIYEGT